MLSIARKSRSAVPSRASLSSSACRPAEDRGGAGTGRCADPRYSPDAIDLAEDRERFQRLLNDIGLKQPANGLGRTPEDVEEVAETIGYPVLLRPSYVLGGRGMEIVNDTAGLRRYVAEAVKVSGDNPVLIDNVCATPSRSMSTPSTAMRSTSRGSWSTSRKRDPLRGQRMLAAAFSLPDTVVDALREQTEKLARALQVRGLMNVQFAVQGDQICARSQSARQPSLRCQGDRRTGGKYDAGHGG